MMSEHSGHIGAARAARRMVVKDPGWLLRALEVVMALADGERSFTSDDVLGRIGPPAPGSDPRALGHVFKAVHRDGFIVPTGRSLVSIRQDRQRGLVREWRGVRGKDASTVPVEVEMFSRERGNREGERS